MIYCPSCRRPWDGVKQPYEGMWRDSVMMTEKCNDCFGPYMEQLARERADRRTPTTSK